MSTTEQGSLADTTYYWERIRGIFTGLIEVLWMPGSGVALLVTSRYFEGGVLSKGLISASGFIGFLFTPLTLSLFAMMRWPIHRNMSLLYLLGAVCLFILPFFDSLEVFVGLAMLAHVLLVQYTPMFTEMYGAHFTTTQRGHRISTVFLIGGACSILASLASGYLLDLQLNLYRPLVWVVAAACVASAACLSQIPTKPLQKEKVGNPLRNLSLPIKDRLFGWMLLSWMLLGFGNLMTLPLRVEYMVNPRFGIEASNLSVLIVTGAIPVLFRLLASRSLGRLFDRWNLVTLRLFLNSLFLLSIVIFFNSRSLWLLGVSMAFLGTAMAGGRITWSLWVTKLAPPGKASSYMSVHMLSTGLRGSTAPFLGFYLLNRMEPEHVGWLGTAMIVVSTLMFLPARPHMALRTQKVDAMALNPQDP